MERSGGRRPREGGSPVSETYRRRPSYHKIASRRSKRSDWLLRPSDYQFGTRTRENEIASKHFKPPIEAVSTRSLVMLATTITIAGNRFETHLRPRAVCIPLTTDSMHAPGVHGSWQVVCASSIMKLCIHEPEGKGAQYRFLRLLEEHGTPSRIISRVERGTNKRSSAPREKPAASTTSVVTQWLVLP